LPQTFYPRITRIYTDYYLVLFFDADSPQRNKFIFLIGANP